MIETFSLPNGAVGLVAHGHINSDDYKNTLVPAVDAAFESGKPVRLLYVLADDFEGYTASAYASDGKFGFEHLRGWDRIALVSDVSWINHSVEAFAWLMPGAVKVFALADEPAALEWIGSD